MNDKRQRLRLGQLLVERGIISESELADALLRQIVQGGRLGSNLVELEYVSISALADALAIQQATPAAELVSGDIISESAVKSLPADACQRYGVLPVRIDYPVLHLAMQDPMRSFVRGLASLYRVQIQPYVVPQLRLLYLLERYCGVPRPKRFLREPRGQVKPGRRAYLRPTIDPQAPDGGGSHRSRHASMLLGTAGSSYELVCLDDLRDPSSETLDFGLASGIRSTAHRRRGRAVSLTTPTAIITTLGTATSRSEIATALVQPWWPQTTLSLLMLPRGDMAIVLAASGFVIRENLLQEVVVPLETPSLFSHAASAKAPVSCSALEDPLQESIAGYLRAPQPAFACAAPIVLANQMVNLLCIHTTAPPTIEMMRTLSDITHAGAAAYRRLIWRQPLLPHSVNKKRSFAEHPRRKSRPTDSFSS